MAKATAAQVPAKVEDRNQLPARLKGVERTAKIGNVDTTDLIVPRIKLLQGISPELTAFDEARAGHFWHSLASVSMGKEVSFIPIIVRKSYVLWAPRNDERGILARSNDAIHWSPPSGSFKVKPKKAGGREVTWTLAPTVAESGLAEFGSEIPGDTNSAPAASLTYNILAYFPDFPELSPAIILNTRSAVKKARLLISKIDLRGVDIYEQQYKMSSIEENAGGEKFLNYNYVSDGYASDELAPRTKEYYERFAAADFRASDENDEEAAPAATSSKF